MRNTSKRVVLDASALLAFFQDESGAETVEKHLPYAIMSTVNWAEVVQKLDEAGVEIDGLEEDVKALGVVLEPFSSQDAETAALLRKTTKKIGLSLGDRACLALASRLGLDAMTADRDWRKASSDVILIRG